MGFAYGLGLILIILGRRRGIMPIRVSDSYQTLYATTR